MTKNKKLDLIFLKLDSLEKDVNTLKRQLVNTTAELKAMDEMILDEVERVHAFLEKHKSNKGVHTA